MRNAILLAGSLILCLAAAVNAGPVGPQAAIPLSAPYTQNFNTLATSGTDNSWANDSTLPGWYASRTAYIAGTGSSNTGALYSFGASGATERALGSIASGSTETIYYGVRLVNDTAAAITALIVSYTGEQWRNGGNTTRHKLAFAYQIGSTMTDLIAGGWTAVSALDFTGPIATETAAALDGNAAANRTAISHTLAVTIFPGEEIMLRWMDVNDSGNDHGLAIDDLTVSASSAPPAACATIPQIQGPGNVSPCLGHRSNIVGCITGVTATGFYFQDETGDGDPATSDGIYAYFYSTWQNLDGLKPGDRVRVSGTVTEYYDATEFAHRVADPLRVTVIGACTPPAPVSIPPVADPEADPMALYERYEGMRVQMTFSGWVVGPTKRFTSRYPAGDPEIAFVDFTSAIPAYSRVFERDYPGYRGINYLSGGLGYDLPDLDFGDEIAGTAVTGVLAYQFDKYTLLVDASPTLTVTDRPDVTANETPADTAIGEFDICFANVENLFDHINDGQGDWGDWAPGWPISNDPKGLAAYQAKLAATASVLVHHARSCMVIGLEEMEGKQGVYDDLAAALHAADPGHTWSGAYVESGDPRDISQGFLWRDDVTLLGSVTAVSGAPYTAWLAPPPDNNGLLDFVRVPATGLFRFNAGRATQTDIRLYAVHFKSKRASDSCTTPDCTDVRELEAADIRDILAHHQAVGEFAIAGGDFNDTFGSSPIAILDASTAIYNAFYGLPERQRWSYIFNGESEVLDHLYLTRNLLPATPGWAHTFNAVHVNADFPSAEHASDHDPLRIRFTPCAATAAPSGLTIARADADIRLAWSAAPNSAAYQVWRGAEPYFVPGGAEPLAVSTTPSYEDHGRIGGAPDYYVIVALNACGYASPPSARVGEFSFTLWPGTP